MRSVQTDDDIDQPNTARQNARQLVVSDLRFVMGTKQGRRFVARLLDQAGLHRRSFTGNSETFFNEGRRSVALELAQDIQTHAFAEHILMLQEAQAK